MAAGRKVRIDVPVPPENFFALERWGERLVTGIKAWAPYAVGDTIEVTFVKPETTKRGAL